MRKVDRPLMQQALAEPPLQGGNDAFAIIAPPVCPTRVRNFASHPGFFVKDRILNLTPAKWRAQQATMRLAIYS